MSKIPEIPKSKLVAQPINAQHRQEFVIEFTRNIFLDRIVAATPADLGNWEEGLNIQKQLLLDAFPLLHKPNMGEVYGQHASWGSVLVWEHEQYEKVLNQLHRYHFSSYLISDRLAENVEGHIMAFGNELHNQIKRKMPNLEACKKYQEKLSGMSYSPRSNTSQEDIEKNYVYIPNGISNVQDIIGEKKVQNDNTGEVTRTPVIKKQFTTIIPKPVQKRILAWTKKKRQNVSADRMQAEMKLMKEFANELLKGLRVIRNTKQFQERLPDMFDEFCFVTGLGQASGQDLICHSDMGTVNTILAQHMKLKGK
jgi:hypothetical protein